MQVKQGAFLIALVLAGFSQNPVPWCLSVVAAWIWLNRFLKPGQHPVWFLALLIPFIEIITSLIYVELEGLTLNEGFGNGGRTAYVYSIVAFMLFMGGVLWGTRRRDGLQVVAEVEQRLLDLPMQKLVIAHVFFHGLSAVTQMLFNQGSSLFQLVLHFGKFHLVFLYLIFWKYSLQRKHKLLVWGLFAVNLALRLGEFFAEWKELIFLLFYTGLVTVHAFDARWLRRMAIVGIAGVALLFTWQAVKMDYRNYLNGGTRSQQVVVGFNSALTKFAELSGEYWTGPSNDQTQEEVFQSTMQRLGYLEFFALTVERVPERVPFQQGALMSQNLTFALVPRFLNPEKGIKNDQWKVEEFAGVEIADNASFSLGRYAEWYVDYGGGMLLCGLLAGLAAVWIVRLICRKGLSRSALIDPIFTVLVLQNFCSYQSDEIVVYGQTFWAIVVYVTIGRPLMVHFLRTSSGNLNALDSERMAL
jgi:hypothetical protein